MNSGLVKRSIALLLPLIVACASTSKPEEEQLGKIDERFTSREAVLLDFALDGRLTSSILSNADTSSLITAQLMYMVGQLNGDRSVGRYERLELSNIKIQTLGANRTITYHAKLPVAWGASTMPTTYAVTVPAQVSDQDQTRFASLYGKTCVDEAAGEVDAGSMFFFYRPQRPGCKLDSDDVVTFPASVTRSAENTTGKYPEYDRIWEDGALHVVTMFSRSSETPSAVDEGVDAYDAFIQRAEDHLRAVQPNDAQRTLSIDASATPPRTRLGAALPDGRTVTIDVMLVGYRLDQDGVDFDHWYDPLTPTADIVLYNGHAGLGENVRTLMTKGTFRPRQYVIWAVNGCDTFAYVDRSLADRRALLNPDDPQGTKYMDTVTNVLSGHFDTIPAISMSFVDALLAARAPKDPTVARAALTYEELFATIDPSQIVVVTGEEDNEFQPGSVAPTSDVAAPVDPLAPNDPLAPSGSSSPGAQSESAQQSEGGDQAGCNTVGTRGGSCGAISVLAALAVILARRRDRRSGSPCRPIR